MEKEVCPKCGSKNVLKIMYGLPCGDAFEGAKREEYVRGGCCVMEENRRCKDCRTEFVLNGGTFAELGW